MLQLKKLVALSALCLIPMCVQAELHLKDFKGSYVRTSTSSGGSPNSNLGLTVGGNFYPAGQTVGVSESLLAHLTIDSHGNGVVDFTSAISFSGFSFQTGNAVAASTNDGTAPTQSFTIEITDHKNGVGKIFTKSANGKSTSVSEFVAIQDSDGKVVKFIQNVIDNPTSAAIVVMNERQVQ